MRATRSIKPLVRIWRSIKHCLVFGGYKAVSQQEPAHVQHTYVALANIGLLFLLVITLLVEDGYNELLQLEAKLMKLLHQLYCANRE